MIKFILKIVKKIVIAFLILYGLNLITSNIGIIIPINIVTLIILTILDFPGLGALIAIYLLI